MSGGAEIVPVEIREILFATDFSDIAEMALPYGAALARRFDATLCVAHFIPPDAVAHLAETDRAAAIASLRQRMELRSEGLLRAAHYEGIRHREVVEYGEVLPGLARVAQERRSDLMVLGMHGRHGIEKMLMGSVADEILRLAELPVLLVGPEVRMTAEAEVNVRQVMYGVDFSPGSGRAMRYAGALAKAWEAKLLLLHVVGDIWKEPEATRMATQEFLRMRLLEKGWMASMEPLQPELLVEFGPVEGRILEVAGRRQVELIVLDVPATEHPDLAGRLPGPLAYNVASHANCPVLAVRGLRQR